MTNFEVRIIGYGGASITSYDGDNEDEYQKACENAEAMLTKVEYSVSITSRRDKDRAVWSQEFTVFILE